VERGRKIQREKQKGRNEGRKRERKGGVEVSEGSKYVESIS
jgi:hypothetical protein